MIRNIIMKVDIPLLVCEIKAIILRTCECLQEWHRLLAEMEGSTLIQFWLSDTFVSCSESGVSSPERPTDHVLQGTERYLYNWTCFLYLHIKDL